MKTPIRWRWALLLIFLLYCFASSLDYVYQSEVTGPDQRQAIVGITPCDTDDECEERNPTLVDKWEE